MRTGRVLLMRYEGRLGRSDWALVTVVGRYQTAQGALKRAAGLRAWGHLGGTLRVWLAEMGKPAHCTVGERH